MDFGMSMVWWAVGDTCCRQERNTGVSPLRRQSAPPPVEMTGFWIGRPAAYPSMDFSPGYLEASIFRVNWKLFSLSKELMSLDLERTPLEFAQSW